MAICTLYIVRSCLSFMVISLPLLSFLCKPLPFSGLSWFYGPFRILDGGADTGFNRVTPEKYTARLFHFCGTRKRVEVKQVGIMGEAKRGILGDSKIGNMGNAKKGIISDSKIHVGLVVIMER